MSIRPALLALGAGALLLAACAGPPASTDALTRGEVEARLARNPEDAEALRELGVLHLRAQAHAKALEALEAAHARRPEDPRTLYFLGLTNEVVGRPQTALRLYERWQDLPRGSAYRDELRGRYGWLLRRQVRRDLRAALVREDSLAAGAAPSGAVGVLPFAYRGEGRDYEPLGRGLAEMIAGDLASVPGLTVVERIRLEALLGELELARSDAFDPATAPRLGRLLRAERLVGGQYAVRDGTLEVDAAVSSAEADELPELRSTRGELAEVIALQKRVVLSLLEELGIDLTPEEQERIERRVPTQNLQAFLSYSRALRAGDAEDFGAAESFFREAVRLDPAFSEAEVRAEEAAAVRSATGTPEGLLEQSLAALAPPAGALERRLSLLGSSLGAHFVPGTETRAPAAEGARSGILGPLPDPPDPPVRD